MDRNSSLPFSVLRTPFDRLFKQRAEKTGIIAVQARLLNGFRTAKAKVLYTLVTYQLGLPGVRPNSPLFRTLINSPTLLQGTPAVEVINEVAPRPNEPVRQRADDGSGCNLRAVGEPDRSTPLLVSRNRTSHSDPAGTDCSKTRTKMARDSFRKDRRGSFRKDRHGSTCDDPRSLAFQARPTITKNW
jgi:Isochorismatase family